MVEVTDSNYQEILANNAVCVFDFSATWCGPCKKLAPIVEEVAKDFEGRAFVGKVDVDDATEFTDQVGIRNVPTIVFYKNGELQSDRLIGATDKATIAKKIEALL